MVCKHGASKPVNHMSLTITIETPCVDHEDAALDDPEDLTQVPRNTIDFFYTGNRRHVIYLPRRELNCHIPLEPH